MRTAKRLFERLVEPAHLERAAALTTQGKRRAPEVAWLLFRLEPALAELRERLLDGAWRPRGFDLLHVQEPKRRLIARAPILDRVMHTALVELMRPALCRGARDEAFACRPGKGTHRAVLRLQELMRRHRFCVHLDLRAYFPSIHLGILRGLLDRRLRDRRFMALVDAVLESGAGLYDDPVDRAWAGLPDDWPPRGRGLPIGALTSQLFAAQVVLDGLDHHVKRQLEVPGYLRYVDDLFLFGDRRVDMRRCRDEAVRWVVEERDLRVKHPNARILSCAGTLHGLGYAIRRDGRRALGKPRQRLQERVRAAVVEDRGLDGLGQSVQASAGVLLF